MTGRDRASLPLLRVLLAVLVLVAFGVTLGGGFVYDDRFIVVENQHLRDVADWHRFFIESSWAGSGGTANNYRPVPLLTLGLNYQIGGLRPFDYHLTNIAVHIANVLLLFAISLRLGLDRYSAWLASALFAVHPLQTEPVAEIVGRMDLLAATGLLGAIACHLKGRSPETRSHARLWWSAAAVLCYALALWSKEHVILLPLVILVIDSIGRDRRRLRDYSIYVSYAAVAVAYLAVRFTVLPLADLAPNGAIDLSNPLSSVSGAVRFVSALGVLGLYLRHSLVPVSLSPDYCYSQILPVESLASRSALATVGVATVLLIACMVLAARSKPAAVALTLASVTFLPVSNLLFPIGTVMGDRLFYIPLAGLGILAALFIGWVAKLSSNLRLWTVCSIVVVGLFSSLSIRQSLAWETDYSLDRQAVKAAPLCARGHSNLGYDFLERGEVSPAEKEFLTAVELFSPYPQARAGLARVAYARQEWEEVVNHAEQVLVVDPEYKAMLNLAADAWRNLADLGQAEKLWLAALELDPNDAQALSNLAVLAWNAGRSERALALWEQAARHPGAQASVFFNLAQAYDRLARVDAAILMYRRFLRAPAEPGNLSQTAFARQRLRALGSDLPRTDAAH